MPPLFMLTAATTVYVTSRDGTSKMSFRQFLDAYKGGMKLEEIEATLDEGESKALERKRLAVEEVNHLMRSMSDRQVRKVVDVLRSDEDLMNTEEGFG